MSPSLIKNIAISVISRYVSEQSDSKNKHYVFSYTITIENRSLSAFQLISRHWLIQNAAGHVEEVYGDGVVGKQPIINPGDNFSYSSGSVLNTEVGTMEGRYFMLDTKGKEFEVLIPKFVLSIPRTIH